MDHSTATEAETVTPALLYERHAAPLKRYLTRLLDNPTVAEDVCQETFLRAVRYWHRRRPDGSASGWLYQIARNLAYDELVRPERICSVALHEARELPSGELLDERWSSGSADRQAAMGYRALLNEHYSWQSGWDLHDDVLLVAERLLAFYDGGPRPARDDIEFLQALERLQQRQEELPARFDRRAVNAALSALGKEIS